MGIQIASAVNQPEITFNKVFLRRLTIDQYEVIPDAPAPKYRIFIEYRLYGVMDGNRYYHPEIREIEIGDFVQEAMSQAYHGNNTLIESMPAIEAAIAALVATDLGTGTEVV